ncbi:alpha/beta fold hydrolase [Geothermobacter hydrogeniphilus]|nr:alpha/beta fold hydrolase [Geothermobacter hydrogeniphilus]
MPSFQLYRLADGRCLAASEFGAADGLPLFYQHGFPGSRLEAALMDEVATEIGLRLIALDRPGYGRSDFCPARTLADWPTDLAAVADQLGIARFGLLGVSGGGPYAMVCRELLEERVLATGIVCGLGPLAGTGLLSEMEWPARFSFSVMAGYPRLAAPIFRLLVTPVLQRWPRLALRLLTVAAPRADRQVLRQRRVRERLTAAIGEAFRGGPDGVVHDLQLYTRGWQIPFGSGGGPLCFWHGLSDRTVPISHSHYLARCCPRAEVNPFAEEGHFSLPVRHGDSILAELKQIMEESDANH